jgi:hypothetical protein
MRFKHDLVIVIVMKNTNQLFLSYLEIACVALCDPCEEVEFEASFITSIISSSLEKTVFVGSLIKKSISRVHQNSTPGLLA